MRVFFFCLLMSIPFAACICTKVYCVEFDYVHVTFYGFEPSEIDTIYSTGYAPGSNFATITREKEIDTGNLSSIDSVYYFESKSNERLKGTHDWEIYIPSTGQTYRITDYSYTTEACNCPSDKYTSLTGCRVNGKASNRGIKIYK